MTSFLCALPLISTLFGFCDAPVPIATGYVEGEFVLVAPVATARIDSLAVRRGDRVTKGQLLVQLDRSDAEIALHEAGAALTQAESTLANLQEGRRPEEIGVIEASLASALAQEEDAQREVARIRSLRESKVAAEAQLDSAETALKVATAKVAEARANLAVARLPARPHEIAAAEAAVAQARSARDRAAWSLAERELKAGAPGVVADVIRTAGELADPQAPVLSVLPDGAVKVRLYVAEPKISAIAPGTPLIIRCDGCAETRATVSYVADETEFTPPVIYSVENRQTLVYLIEARIDPGSADLKPGQIVDAYLAGGAP